MANDPDTKAPEHGGRLRAAAAHYGVPLSDWLDLSTGVSPYGWPVPPLSARSWARLPEEDDGLEAAAAAYYESPNGLAVAGSQAAIQALPQLFPHGSVTCLSPLYNEHPHAWRAQGHAVRLHPAGDLRGALAAGTPHIVLCNPNNPTGQRYGGAELLEAAASLGARGGVLVVDEAFIDVNRKESLAAVAGSEAAPNLIVLRSLGKFFGLAGARVGFLFASADLRARLAFRLGPWTIAGPSREVARLALSDRSWQGEMRRQLREAGQRLVQMLEPMGVVGATPLFATVSPPRADEVHEFFARAGILTRYFKDNALVRFGLPDSEAAWERLAAVLAEARGRRM
ncbi:threonine-phosphate decarboxylase CobD [Azoarcus sp. DN11]|uniref:threonine-phosphate decarboxylase CobD n=1 Tax=Azoarcus sp. DN11 TaxID=356837 RepID=UPI000EAC9260|nr:threonine-phosphate decarboxylase CobD [Azoarcus sp. DN11]AYH43966.1 threonine-phosphate decarboxylase [Azoarcus sp. DN11]